MLDRDPRGIQAHQLQRDAGLGTDEAREQLQRVEASRRQAEVGAAAGTSLRPVPARLKIDTGWLGPGYGHFTLRLAYDWNDIDLPQGDFTTRLARATAARRCPC